MSLTVALSVVSRFALTVLAPGLGASTATTTPAAQVVAQSLPAPTGPLGTVVFGGDVVPHGALLRSVEANGPASLFAPVAPVLRAADLSLVNLETPVSRSRPITRAGFHF